MEGYKSIPKFVFLIPLITFLSFGSFFWTNNPQNIKTPVREEVFDEFKIPPPSPTFVNPPKITAKSSLIFDISSKAILFSKNPNLRFSPASATKIMTALVALNHYQLDKALTIDGERIIGSTMGLRPNEKMTVLNLLYGLLLASGNDAAYTLAKNYPGGVDSFVGEMNGMALNLGLKNTHFTDPAGLSDGENFTTTLDLVKLSLVALKNPTFSQIVATREKSVFDTTGRRRHDLQNLNRLLWEVPHVLGIKTGFTEQAGGVLVVFFKQEREILTVVFKSEDRFLDTKNLIDWTLRSTKKR